jgi:hypothetical protein
MKLFAESWLRLALASFRPANAGREGTVARQCSRIVWREEKSGGMRAPCFAGRATRIFRNSRSCPGFKFIGKYPETRD